MPHRSAPDRKRARPERIAGDDTYKHIGVFSDVVSRIKSEYVEEPDMKSVTLGALNGMLEAIDPFASYLNADQYRDYLKNKDVKRADVGLILSKKFGYVGVVGTITGSPAAKANFTTGDMIESIGGVATRDMPLAYAGMLLRGESGTTVELSVVRTRHPEPAAVKLTRANFALPAVESRMLADKVGYVNVDALSPELVKQVAAAVAATAEGRRAETDAGRAQLRHGHARRRHRAGQSLPEQGPHHLSGRAESAAAELRGRPGQGDHHAAGGGPDQSRNRRRGGSCRRRADGQQARPGGGRAHLRRCRAAQGDHDGRRRRDHPLRGEILLARRARRSRIPA